MDLATLLPAGGIAGTLAIVIVYLLNSNRLDRAERRMERDEDRKAMAAMRTDYDEQLKEMRARLDTLEREVDEERRLRLEAEARAAAESLRANSAEHMLAMMRMVRGEMDDRRDPGAP